MASSFVNSQLYPKLHVGFYQYLSLGIDCMAKLILGYEETCLEELCGVTFGGSDGARQSFGTKIKAASSPICHVGRSFGRLVWDDSLSLSLGIVAFELAISEYCIHKYGRACHNHTEMLSYAWKT